MREMVLRQYVVDAFTDQVFRGNPAAVCVLENWLPDEVMLNIARENNLSETAFTMKQGNGYALRWFTPGGEIDLCGHATLGTAYVLLRFWETEADRVTFETKSGTLQVTKIGDRYEMNLPAYSLKRVPVTEEMTGAIGFRPTEAWMGRDLVCVLEREDQVVKAAPDGELVKALDGLLLHLTARGTEYDCVTRSFAPKLRIPEDPVCGSGHCHVIPLWVEKMGRASLTAYQASQRSGVLYCRLEGERVFLSGKAVLYASSEIHIPV